MKQEHTSDPQFIKKQIELLSTNISIYISPVLCAASLMSHKQPACDNTLK